MIQNSYMSTLSHSSSIQSAAFHYFNKEKIQDDEYLQLCKMGSSSEEIVKDWPTWNMSTVFKERTKATDQTRKRTARSSRLVSISIAESMASIPGRFRGAQLTASPSFLSSFANRTPPFGSGKHCITEASQLRLEVKNIGFSPLFTGSSLRVEAPTLYQ